MAGILAIDTSTEVCSVAYFEEGILKNIIEEHRRYVHASMLAPLIKKVLHLSNVEKPDAIALSSGPGSYTGLRIGFGTAKGLCYAWDIPLIGISSLLSLAQQFNTKADFNVPIMDSRKGEVYAAIYDNKLRKVVEPEPLSVDDLHEKLDVLKGTIICGGNGAYKLNTDKYKLNNIQMEEVYSSARGLLKVSLRRFEQKRFESVFNYKPLYLKQFQSG
ncbi:MAG: tRNA (adenosine(37)-N6)-threonylcarbamoyltransferase complex dimerization subunit type 1 TsaB [Chitinophagales bacterium]|nr:tRNA (adenosine(37)-N6)-threonylcarbamoyltransferase complex dimerization subunit type 1 TsaB [Chitinophagales bacterium]